MALIRTEALVLRAVDFSESTQIAHFFSPTVGKFTAMARGVKRMKSRVGPRLEPFSQVELSVYSREGASIGSLSSIELLRRWSILQRDLQAHAMAALILESIDRGTEENKPAAEIYRLSIHYLHLLEEETEPQSLTAHTLLRLICLLGFAPDLREPAGGQGALFLHPEEGTLQSAPPPDLRLPRLRLDPLMRDWLRLSMGLPSDLFHAHPAPEGYGRPLINFLVELIQYHLEIELKSMRFVRKMLWES